MTIECATIQIRSHLDRGPDIDVQFRDERTGLLCVIATPAARPGLWQGYLDGVESAYRSWGVIDAFDRASVADGASTTFFCAVVDGQRVVGGSRVQGPYQSAAQSHALVEWAGQPSQARLVDAIEDRLAEGLVEVKSAYVDVSGPHAGRVANLLSRIGLIGFEVTGARHSMATAAEHVLARWSEGGGRIDPTIAATPYPDPRYRTQVMFWDRRRLSADADPRVWALMLREYAEVFGQDAPEASRAA